MTRINWDEVHELKHLDEIIAYCIITLEEAYTARDNEDLDTDTRNDISQWIQWSIGYDEQGRAFFRYAANLYMVDRTPMSEQSILSLIKAPTRYLVFHPSIYLEERPDDTSLKIDTTTQIPNECDNLERLLYWAVVIANYWGKILRYLADNGDAVPLPPNPLDSPAIPPVQFELAGVSSESTVDGQFDAYNGKIDDPSIPSFLVDLLERSPTGTGSVDQNITLPARDAGNYRENLTTCEEQDPKITNYSQGSLDALLQNK